MSDTTIRGYDGAAFPWVQVTAAGAIVTAPGAPPVAALCTRDDPGAAVASRVISVVPAVLAGFLFRSSVVFDRFLHVFDLAAVPADGAAPSIAPVCIPANGQGSLMLPESLFAVGLCWASSTTENTLTLAGEAASLWVTTLWRLP